MRRCFAADVPPRGSPSSSHRGPRSCDGRSVFRSLRRGALSLFDFLDAERTYRATQVGYRQALADYLLAVERVRQSVGIRALP
jgi:hypothetical protein